MKIGIDLDGTILNSENMLKFYADYFSYFYCNGKTRKRNDIVSQENCFDWTKEEEDEFFEKFFDKASEESELIPGAKEIISRLKQDGHKLYIISLRGYYRDAELEVGDKTVEKLGIKFDGVFWKVKNKLDVCKKQGIDVLIDNDSRYVKDLKGENIKVIYLRDGYTEKVAGPNIIQAETWVDVYREIKNLGKK